MKPSDITNIQKLILDGVSQSTSKLVSAWTEAMKTAGTQNVHGMCRNFGLEWLSPAVITRITESSSMAIMMHEFFRVAVQDLQDLVKQACNPKKVETLKEKWMQTYEMIIRQLFGIPTHDELERLARQWRSMIESFTGTGIGLQSELMGMALFTGSVFPAAAAAYQTVLPLFAEAYENTFGKFFRMPGLGLTREYEERTKKALEAEAKFLTALPNFQKQLVEASKTAMDNVVGDVVKMEIDEVTPETYQVFYKIWVSRNEDSFTELFRSEQFCRTLADTLHKGLEAKKKMDMVIADGLSLFNIPTNKDMEEVYESVYHMKKRIRLLERELEDLRRKTQMNNPRELIS